MKKAYFLLVLTACCLPPKPINPDVFTCETACANMRTMSCPLGEPTAKGTTCEQVCENTLTGPARMDVECLSNAKTCEACD